MRAIGLFWGYMNVKMFKRLGCWFCSSTPLLLIYIHPLEVVGYTKPAFVESRTVMQYIYCDDTIQLGDTQYFMVLALWSGSCATAPSPSCTCPAAHRIVFIQIRRIRSHEWMDRCPWHFPNRTTNKWLCKRQTHSPLHSIPNPIEPSANMWMLFLFQLYIYMYA